jgi:outer membrane protein assembly factor BamB
VQYVPEIVGGTAIIGCQNRGQGGNWKAIAITLSSGRIKWQIVVDHWMELSPIAVESAVMCGTDNGSVYALDQDDGKVVWVSEDPKHLSIWAMTATPSLVVFISYDGSVHALDATTGSLRWVHSHHDDERTAIRINPVVWKDNVIYFLSSSHLLRCLELATGHERWELVLPSVFDGHHMHAYLAENLLFLPSSNGELHVINLSTRTVVGTLHGNRNYEPHTPVALGGVLYYRDAGGNIYCRPLEPSDVVDVEPSLIVRTDSAEPGELSVHDHRVYCPSGPWLYVIEPRPADGIPTGYHIHKYKAPHRFVTGLAHEGDVFCAGIATDKLLIGRLPSVATSEESHSR